MDQQIPCFNIFMIWLYIFMIYEKTEIRDYFIPSKWPTRYSKTTQWPFIAVYCLNTVSIWNQISSIQKAMFKSVLLLLETDSFQHGKQKKKKHWYSFIYTVLDHFISPNWDFCGNMIVNHSGKKKTQNNTHTHTKHQHLHT